MERSNRDVILAAVDGFNRHDLAAFRAAFSDEPELVPLRAALETDTAYRGPRAIEEFWKALRETWSEVRIEVEDIQEAGDRVVLVGLLRMRARGSGAVIEQRVGWVATVEDGAARHLRTYADPTEALAELAP